MEGRVGLVGWPVVDDLPIQLVTCQMQVERRTEKVRRPKTNVLPCAMPPTAVVPKKFADQVRELCELVNWYLS